ncbi:hypothetical protein GCM10009304_10890 [Pseudomonas matsuisoli]|uniref:Uncharacterized protein n=1 Tax=Pseudomonas matsuisoli TaxID=1515666 RepID=A0A917PQ27_9PSED|nr:hypothetical protein GCM10009304_10890 [Pseudomonas matsuisoli]
MKIDDFSLSRLNSSWPRDFDVRTEYAEQKELLEDAYQIPRTTTDSMRAENNDQEHPDPECVRTRNPGFPRQPYG